MFKYVDGEDFKKSDDVFTIHIPSDVDSEEFLFGIFFSQGEFPGYFGENWDALFDFLTDFSWIKKREILVVHEDIPFPSQNSKRIIYLEILRDACFAWSKKQKNNLQEPPSNWEYIEHDFRVVFPNKSRAVISSLVQF